ncbi:MAG: phospholipid carrier-dependent glycosyltransferase, partial [Steroidobacteraceae bacterium]
MSRLSARMPLLATRTQGLGFAPAALIVALVASINFLANLGYPPYPIWDESYYLTAIARYEQHIAQFASHPPLGLELITAGDVLLHPNRRLDTRHIGWDKKIAGDQLPKGYSFAGVRLMPGVFGVLGAVAFFGLMYVLTQSVLASLAFSNLYLFDNALIVHFRAAQLDPFQIAFVLGTLLCFAVSARRGQRSSPGVDALYGACCGFACMAKLNASVLAFLGLMLIARRIGMGWRRVPRPTLLLAGARDGLLMAGGCLAAIALVMTLHVALNPLAPVASSPAGRKDLGFVTPVYAAYLHHERPLSPAVVLDASRDYLRFTFADLAGVPRIDPNGSKPFVWPLMRGTINYRWDSTGAHTAYVQLTGNPVAWFLGFLALIASAALILAWSWQSVRRAGSADRRAPPAAAA